jgi:hypothetical protein
MRMRSLAHEVASHDRNGSRTVHGEGVRMQAIRCASARKGRIVIGRLLTLAIAYPLAGALFAGGALFVLRRYGADNVRPLGRAGGEGFAEGMATYNRMRQTIADATGQPIS